MSFPKDARLLTRRDFLRVMRGGQRVVGKYFCIDIKAAKKARLGISASGKYGSSPERNRFKRLIREAFRQNRPSLPPYELNVIPRKLAKNTSQKEISEEFFRLLGLLARGV